MATKLLGRICHKCNTYCKGSDPCMCPPGSERNPTFQVMGFKPYQENDAPGRPTFETREQRDKFLADNQLGYDKDTKVRNRKPPRKELVTPEVEAAIIENWKADKNTTLPARTADEKRVDPRFTV